MQGPFLIVTRVALPAGGVWELDVISKTLLTSLLTIPSVTRVARLTLVKGDGPQDVVIWETERWEASVTRAYDAAVKSSSTNGSVVVGQPRAVYQETTRFRQAHVMEGWRHILLVQMDIPTEFEGEFNDWYDGEHIPMLMQVPGWIAAIRYIRIEGEVPKYMTIYKLEGPWALDKREHEMTHQTEWYRRVRPHFENFSSLLYEQFSESHGSEAARKRGRW